jgi:hypothetical protein
MRVSMGFNGHLAHLQRLRLARGAAAPRDERPLRILGVAGCVSPPKPQISPIQRACALVDSRFT